MLIGGKNFITDGSYTYIMGILNVTPDSFSDGGKYHDPDAALLHALQLIREGADILDIGAESTRPGHDIITGEEELERLLPVLKRIRNETDIPISIDSRNPGVMDEALKEGGDMANDIWGFRSLLLHPEAKGPSMAEIVAKHGKPAIIMHNDLLGRDEVGRNEDMIKASSVSQEAAEDVVLRVREGLDISVDIAKEAGIPTDMLIMDPGIGFAKSTRENLIILNNLDKLRKDGEAWMLAASRKSVIGDVLKLPPDQREEGTLVTTQLAAEAGYSFVRVHNVAASRRALDFLRAVRNI